MEDIKIEKKEPISSQIKLALDGRTYRWLSIEARIPEASLSRKINGKEDWSNDELERIENRLNFKIQK